MVSAAAAGCCCASMRNPDSSRTKTLRIRRIDPLEILQDRAPLVGAQPAQLFPCRLAELQRGPACGARVVGLELVACLCRFGLALVRVVALLFLERPAGIEQPAE